MNRLEVERAFLGLLLLRAAELGGALPHLDTLELEPSDLTGRHARVFAAIRRLHERGARIGLREVVDELRPQDEVHITDLAYWTTLCIEYDLAAISRVADVIREHAQRDLVETVAQELIQIAITWPLDAEERVATAIGRLSRPSAPRPGLRRAA